ncbi:hypothetical protein GUITHDRAFT_116319 [Guillardia theta CCMP2712]|uniref:Uncharacterized protein n=1 Tax=Guillardia theta (strain CCMP2712) TaxID=905079 RepID=L1INW6_GUITC|nr:hypothetical protein GUITHDRAFT_116319 [Guillardia theta CCMP2712]EKX37510.1 hypothetical protein GUITHDRAFT_116319 [Guillardia theta CCMP2712]|eukprot:XP_005824490.1 hypothetical protein GUITHDRAFT_116319 [Guillardia theta CCMP2712]
MGRGQRVPSVQLKNNITETRERRAEGGKNARLSNTAIKVASSPPNKTANLHDGKPRIADLHRTAASKPEPERILRPVKLPVQSEHPARDSQPARLSLDEFIHAKRCLAHPSIEESLRPYRSASCAGRVTQSV